MAKKTTTGATSPGLVALRVECSGPDPWRSGEEVYGQADARSPTIKRIAIVDLARKPEEITINGARAWKAYFTELKKLGCEQRRRSPEPRRRQCDDAISSKGLSVVIRR